MNRYVPDYKGDPNINAILTELENIDDEMEEMEVKFVKLGNGGASHGIEHLPAVAFFKKGTPTVYEVKPEIEDIAKFSEWKKKDAKSKMLITTALEFKYLQQIVNCQTSAEMWKKLSTIYELKPETNKYLLQ
ncbi:hypothetical protein LAZ67_13002302 [Cordylochernes scorpioides]|uniref:Uncharacterized protein n=1 Tax=Cordylochernes scorpioides TaxID=51811 RepID=A0ABY6L4H3_9ARAC|nr:hypothetical protein LAZ67_13002302 [Cordylochernes scorpioides]